MKKCPKCLGKGIIQNYVNIDGGTCYECNGKKYVSQDHKLYQKPKTKFVPEWVKQEEEKVRQQAHQKRIETISSIHDIIGGKKGLAREVFELMDSEDQRKLYESNESEFKNLVVNFFQLHTDVLKDECPEYFN